MSSDLRASTSHVRASIVCNTKSHPNGISASVWCWLQGGKNVSGISRAVSRLASRKVGIRDATLAWLQQTARSREPEHLVLKRATDLGPLVKAARDHEVCTSLCWQSHLSAHQLASFVCARADMRQHAQHKPQQLQALHAVSAHCAPPCLLPVTAKCCKRDSSIKFNKW